VSYIGHLRGHWPDDTLGEHCLRFVEAYHAFWVRNARILHLRNAYADTDDERMRKHRIEVSLPLIELFVRQMEGDPAQIHIRPFAMASVLFTGIERMITVTTDVSFTAKLTLLKIQNSEAQMHRLLEAEARLLELGIRDCREMARTQKAAGA
jgi:hypothetical protein